MSILIVVASQNGHTLKAAQIIETELAADLQMPIKIIPASEAEIGEMMEWENWLLGSSTWGNGDLHREMDRIERELRDHDLENKWCAAFGTGNSMYPHFCEAVDILETRLKNSGAHIIQKGLKIDRMTGMDQEAIVDWARWIAQRIS